MQKLPVHFNESSVDPKLSDFSVAHPSPKNGVRHVETIKLGQSSLDAHQQFELLIDSLADINDVSQVCEEQAVWAIRRYFESVRAIKEEKKIEWATPVQSIRYLLGRVITLGYQFAIKDKK